MDVAMEARVAGGVGAEVETHFFEGRGGGGLLWEVGRGGVVCCGVLL